ncbi:MAG: hypothetical protein RIG63_19915 [Coleofasciculus chthonoplastes F3-SA18-01]|jgi:hypothetical protein|uniref:hypothetical protein n=1 Tax=Coleofasciculus chthonoplastes TaxID=64178 RepID=UPI0032F5A2FB
MTGKVIDSSTTGILILLLPIAFVFVLLFKTWPYLLALLVVIILLKIWQQYRWLQWSKQVNPFFNQLIKDNQGCLTPLDLSMKANISGTAAQRYLDRKAEEFGAKRRDYEDKGIVYYFLTANALGSIFDSSEPLPEQESESFTNQAPKLVQWLMEDEMEEEIDEESETEEAEIQDKAESPPEKSSPQIEDEEKESQALIQAELAKRLDVHSSTIGKRKSDPDFAQWSQTKDPDGVAWEYSPETKEFLPVEES